MLTPDEAYTIVRPRRGRWAAYFLLAIAEQESGQHDRKGALVGFDDRAFAQDKNGGSYGLFQLDVPTARDRGFTGAPCDLFNPGICTGYAVRQFDWLKDELARHGALGLQSLIAAYNEGVANVLRGNPDPRYVAGVMMYRERWRIRLGEGVQ